MEDKWDTLENLLSSSEAFADEDLRPKVVLLSNDFDYEFSSSLQLHLVKVGSYDDG